MGKGERNVKNVWKLSNYLFDWYWKKWGKTITIASLCLGILLLIYIAISVGNPDSYEYYSTAFRSYDMAVDSSFLPVVFIVGLLMVFIANFVQIKGFSINAKGTYTLFMLPMKRKDVYFSFLLLLVASVAVYYLLWLVLLVAAYFPVTAFLENAAAKEILYFAEGTTLTGLDTSIENGLFLAFRRSLFLSACFPSSLWHAVPFLAGLLLTGTGFLYAGFRTERIGNCILVSGGCILMGLYLFVGATLCRLGLPLILGGGEGNIFLGTGVLLGLIAILAAILIHRNTIKYLEEHAEL